MPGVSLKGRSETLRLETFRQQQSSRNPSYRDIIKPERTKPSSTTSGEMATQGSESHPKDFSKTTKARKGRKSGAEYSDGIQCQICGKLYKNKSGLHYHMQHHTGKYGHKCQICQKGFTTKQSLEDHKLKHSGQSYNCDYCEKSFSGKRGYEIHMRSHSGLYPFYCDLCSKGFSLQKRLTEHLNAEHKGEGFKCETCEKIFHTQFGFSGETSPQTYRDLSLYV